MRRLVMPARFLIPAIVLVSIGLILSGLIIVDKLTLGKRVTASANEYLAVTDVLTTQELLHKSEGPINLNGDDIIRGTYQLTQPQAERLATTTNLLKCTKSIRCIIEKNHYTGGVNNYCFTAIGDPDYFYGICINMLNNQASWSFTWM